MGLRVEGKWQHLGYDTKRTGGAFQHPESRFRDINESGGRFPPEPGRSTTRTSGPRPATSTVDFLHIKGHSYMSHPTVNPHGIAPAGPEIDGHAPRPRAAGVPASAAKAA